MIKSDGGTQTVSSGEEWFRTRVKGGWDRKIRPAVCLEKPLGKFGYLYHKQTHVDEMNILRRSGDGLFRN